MFPMFINKSSFNSIEFEILQSRAVLILVQCVCCCCTTHNVQEFVWHGVYSLPLPMAMRLFDLNRHSINRTEWGGQPDGAGPTTSKIISYWNKMKLYSERNSFDSAHTHMLGVCACVCVSAAIKNRLSNNILIIFGPCFIIPFVRSLSSSLPLSISRMLIRLLYQN